MSIQIMSNIEILIQPSAHYRMRYEAEKRDRNYLTGRMDTMVNPNDGTITILPNGPSRQSANQTTVYPKIRIYNPNKRFGKLIIVCVSKSPVSNTDPSYYLHPNKLIGENCKNGFAEINFGSDEYIIIDLKKICIQHVKKKDTFESLNTYMNNNIDPFNNANESINNLQNIDLNQLRLCFQAVFYDTTFDCKNKIVETTLPAVSSIISNNCQELIIEHISLARDTVLGGNKLIILIRKMSLNTKNIYARFYNLANTWSAQVNVSSFHYGSAIVIIIPPYIDINITEPVECNCQLVYIPNDNNNCFDEISDTLYSESFKFVYEPIIKVLKKRLSDDVDNDEKYACRNGSSSICSNSNCSNSSSCSSSSSSKSSNSNSSCSSTSSDGMTTSQSPVDYSNHPHPKANKKVRGIWGLSEAAKVAAEKQIPPLTTINFTNTCFQKCCFNQTQSTLSNSDDDTMQDSESIYTKSISRHNHNQNTDNNNNSHRNYMFANILNANAGLSLGKPNEMQTISFPLQNSISYESLFNANNVNPNYQIMLTDNNNNNNNNSSHHDECMKQLSTSSSATSINHNKYSPFQSLNNFQRLVINPANNTASNPTTSQNQNFHHHNHHNNVIGFTTNPNHPLLLNTFCIPKPTNKNNLM